MSHKHIFGIGFALALALTGCGSAATSQTVAMMAIGSSGPSGTAVLTDNGNSTTSVALATTGGTDSGAQAAHIHTGVCGSAGPVYAALTNVQSGVGTSTVAFPLSGLTGGKYYINIHKSSDPSVIQACGQIK